MQTMAPMPSVTLPAQSAIGSRVIPHLGRLLALPLELVGVAKQVGKAALKARELTEAFARGLQRGLQRSRKREA
jgi:hypothetical protein